MNTPQDIINFRTRRIVWKCFAKIGSGTTKNMWVKKSFKKNFCHPQGEKDFKKLECGPNLTVARMEDWLTQKTHP